MAVRIVNQNDVERQHLPGRDLRWFATKETMGCEQLSIAIMNCPPWSVVKPVHAHKDIEEILLILQGEGMVWVDGEYAKFKTGDAVLFPANSKHQTRCLGDEELVTASIFAGVTKPESYIFYEGEDMFADMPGKLE